MLRVCFTAEDLLRVRFADDPAPMVELMLAVAMLQRSDAVFGLWRRQVGRKLTPSLRPLSELVPATGKGPLFLDPPDSDFDGGLDRVLSSPTALVRSELQRVHARDRRPSPWTRELADRDRHAWQRASNMLCGVRTRASSASPGIASVPASTPIAPGVPISWPAGASARC
ncbi:regulator [Embleya sp. NPDC008237]|uniref:regulator n=1 Tax=Embleya sp. NPDC008237 TaxID=3363978 RepID=UPI0036E9C1FD